MIPETIDCPRCAGTGKIPNGTHFWKLRKEAGLTLRDVAAASGFSLSYIGHLETGHRPMSRNHATILRGAIEKLARGE